MYMLQSAIVWIKALPRALVGYTLCTVSPFKISRENQYPLSLLIEEPLREKYTFAVLEETPFYPFS